MHALKRAALLAAVLVLTAVVMVAKIKTGMVYD